MASSQAKGRMHRAKVMAQRSARPMSGMELAQAQQVVDEEAHNFRLPEAPRDPSKKDAILTVFHVRESQVEIEKRISLSRCAYQYSPEARKADEKTYAKVIPIPLRPPWTNKMSREQVNRNERKRFEKYLELIYEALPPGRLNHFEHNLDVWRQLWRTCELSDVLLLCVDARHPLFHFPPSLHDYIVNKMRKPMVVVFNKIDLVPHKVLMEWKQYFETKFHNVTVVFFSSYPLPGTITFEEANLAARRKQVAGLDGRAVKKPKPFGVPELIDAVRKIVIESVLTKEEGDPQQPCGEDMAQDHDETNREGTQDQAAQETAKNTTPSGDSDRYEVDAQEVKHSPAETKAGDHEEDDDPQVQELADTLDEIDLLGKPKSAMTSLLDAAKIVKEHMRDGATQVVTRGVKTRVFTIGMVGHPNAGKSSLINSLLGRNAVSVSNTPGHTKHLQTITALEGARDIQLCDCPGLVFPAADMPRPLQVLMGIFPLSSLREPYSAVQYLAERLPLIDIYELQPYLGADSDAALAGPAAPISLLVEHITTQRTRALQRKIAQGLADPDAVIEPVTEQDIAGFVTSPLPLPPDVGGDGRTKQRGTKAKPKNRRHGDAEDGLDEIDMFEALNEAIARDSVLRKAPTRSQDGPGPASGVDSSGLASTVDGQFVWSAWRICEALAVKKNWREEGGRPDTFKAGMHILKDTLEGRVSLYFLPPSL